MPSAPLPAASTTGPATPAGRPGSRAPGDHAPPRGCSNRSVPLVVPVATHGQRARCVRGRWRRSRRSVPVASCTGGAKLACAGGARAAAASTVRAAVPARVILATTHAGPRGCAPSTGRRQPACSSAERWATRSARSRSFSKARSSSPPIAFRRSWWCWLRSSCGIGEQRRLLPHEALDAGRRARGRAIRARNPPGRALVPDLRRPSSAAC